MCSLHTLQHRMQSGFVNFFVFLSRQNFYSIRLEEQTNKTLEAENLREVAGDNQIGIRTKELMSRSMSGREEDPRPPLPSTIST